MLKGSKVLMRALIKTIKKAHLEQQMLTSSEMLLVLEQLKNICQSQKYIDAVVVCTKAHMAKELSLKGRLTQREEDIILLIGKGCSSNYISKSLNISRFTVEAHRKNIRKKFKQVPDFDLSIFSFIYVLQHDYMNKNSNLH